MVKKEIRKAKKFERLRKSEYRRLRWRKRFCTPSGELRMFIRIPVIILSFVVLFCDILFATQLSNEVDVYVSVNGIVETYNTKQLRSSGREGYGWIPIIDDNYIDIAYATHGYTWFVWHGSNHVYGDELYHVFGRLYRCRTGTYMWTDSFSEVGFYLDISS